MRKEIKWVFAGEEHTGYAELEDGILALRNAKGEAFETLEQDDIENGMTLEDIFDDIPEDVTGYGDGFKR